MSNCYVPSDSFRIENQNEIKNPPTIFESINKNKDNKILFI